MRAKAESAEGLKEKGVLNAVESFELIYGDECEWVTSFICVGDDITDKADIIINSTSWYAGGLVSVNYAGKNLGESGCKSFCLDFVISGKKGNRSPVGESCSVAFLK